MFIKKYKWSFSFSIKKYTWNFYFFKKIYFIFIIKYTWRFCSFCNFFCIFRRSSWLILFLSRNIHEMFHSFKKIVNVYNFGLPFCKIFLIVFVFICKIFKIVLFLSWNIYKIFHLFIIFVWFFCKVLNFLYVYQEV